MTLNDLLKNQSIDPHRVVVMRHRPQEPGLNKVFPWLAAEKPRLFNAYQQSHSTKVQNALEKLCGEGFLASFIGIAPGEAVFAGLYEIAGAEPVSYEDYWRIPENIELGKLGMLGWKKEDSAGRTLWFDLKLTPHFRVWSGRLTVFWPPPERSWFRRSERNEMRVLSIPKDSLFTKAIPDWETIRLTWSELQVIPASWRAVFSQWRGIYFIYQRCPTLGS